VKPFAVRRCVALFLTGFGLTTSIRAEPVPLAKPRKPAVSIAAVREAAAIEGTVRAAPEITPPELFNSGMPVISQFPGENAPRSFPAFEPFPARANDRATASTATTAFDPFSGSPGRAYDPRGPQSNPGGVRGLWNGITKWTGERAKALTDAVAGPETQPDARVGQPMTSGVMNPNWNAPPNGMPPQARMPMQPFRGTTPGGRAAYAGNPAYRWYGWGTTTPGANPYAPAGEYPAASSQWYTMSGATPGAFPVPVTNPFRPMPGVGAPAYAVNTSTVPVPSVAPPPFATTAASFVPEGPKPIVETAPFRYVPPDELPASTGPVPSVPAATGNWRGGAVPVPPKTEEFPVRPSTAEPVWQPIQNAAPTKGPTLFIGQSLAKPTAQSDILQAVAFEPDDYAIAPWRVRRCAISKRRSSAAMAWSSGSTRPPTPWPNPPRRRSRRSPT
jgi:hypothetical protein